MMNRLLIFLTVISLSGCSLLGEVSVNAEPDLTPVGEGIAKAGEAIGKGVEGGSGLLAQEIVHGITPYLERGNDRVDIGIVVMGLVGFAITYMIWRTSRVVRLDKLSEIKEQAAETALHLARAAAIRDGSDDAGDSDSSELQKGSGSGLGSR